jgi:hypothetical protein
VKRALLLLPLLLGGCVFEPRNLEGFPCEADEECLTQFGYRCVDAVCLLAPPDPDDAGPAPSTDAGPEDAPDAG